MRAADDTQVVEALHVLDQVFDGDRANRANPERRDGRSDVHDVLYDKWLGAFTFDGWPQDAVRAVLLAFLQYAPAESFDALMEAVRAEATWQVEYRQQLAVEARLRRRLGREPSSRELTAELARSPLYSLEEQGAR
jgi:hypothetical protein